MQTQPHQDSPQAAPGPGSSSALTDGGKTHSGDHGLKPNSLGAPAIAFYIIAAASPLTGVVGLVPIMIGLGNGAGTPGAFIIAAGILLLFAVGYLAMSRHVTNAGALYAYTTLGLGRVVGLGSAAVTVFAYSCIQFSLYGGFGYYLSSLLHDAAGVDVPWWVCAIVAMLACLALGLQGVHAGGVILGVLITLECTMLLTLGAGIVFSSDTAAASEGFSLTPFSIPTVFAAGVGVSVMLAHTTFIGFEGSAIYAEEAKNPRRTIPRATYFAVVFMACVYALTSYLVINAIGVDDAQAVAQKESGNLIFFVADTVLGGWIAHTFQVLIITALFAAIVTFHNNLSRYLYALGRQGLVWNRLGHTRKVQKTPHVAATVQTISAAAVVAGFAIAGLDPYTTLFTWLAGIGTIGIVTAQILAGVAIFVFFRRNDVDKRRWHTVIAPLLAIAGLGSILVLALSSLDLLLGASQVLTWILIGLLILFGLLGSGYALWLRRSSRERYDRMQVMLTAGEAPSASVADVRNT
ncbi:APC family permease [Microbispora amethystogenes]|uniref:Amino acid permease n=1 Tax=Microbispora amethystogenes TaxID=1427754 RepID=A0ABQ4FMR3_9ACTN|nr:APC family permease [Microbispora amethystogenes]GIH36096.1 amino acid permease [Microbispora amethystogenes]